MGAGWGWQEGVGGGGKLGGRRETVYVFWPCPLGALRDPPFPSV